MQKPLRILYVWTRMSAGHPFETDCFERSNIAMLQHFLSIVLQARSNAS